MKKLFLVMTAVLAMAASASAFAQGGPGHGRGSIMRGGQMVRNCPNPNCPNRANCPNKDNCPNPNCPRKAQKPPAAPAK